MLLTHRWGPQENVRGGGHWYVRALRASRAWVRKVGRELCSVKVQRRHSPLFCLAHTI